MKGTSSDSSSVGGQVCHEGLSIPLNVHYTNSFLVAASAATYNSSRPETPGPQLNDVT